MCHYWLLDVIAYFGRLGTPCVNSFPCLVKITDIDSKIKATVASSFYLSMAASRSKTSVENLTRKTALSLRGGKPVELL